MCRDPQPNLRSPEGNTEAQTVFFQGVVWFKAQFLRIKRELNSSFSPCTFMDGPSHLVPPFTDAVTNSMEDTTAKIKYSFQDLGGKS